MSELEKNDDKQTIFKEEKQNVTPHSSPEKTTGSGLDQNLAGLLCYLLGFITGIIFLLIEKDNRFVKFHALQSIFISVAIFIVNMVLSVIPLIGWLVSLLMSPLILILWIVLMMKAYQGKMFKLPIIGDMVEKQMK